MRDRLKYPVLKLMHWLGIIRFFQFLNRNKIAILTIHGVMDDKDNLSWKPLRPQLSPKKLEECLSVLSRRYQFVSLMDAVEMLAGHKPMQPYSLVLTFDDGYRNNFTHALPILCRYNAPATFFVPTGYVDNPRPFWFDRLDYALQKAQVSELKVEVGSVSMHLDNSTRKKLQESFKKFRRAAKELQMSDYEFLHEIEKSTTQLEEKSSQALAEIQENDDWSSIMSWEQIEKNCNGDFTIGSHTIDHIRLGLVVKEKAIEQLVRSKRDIENHTGKQCKILSYPNGSFTEETVNIAKKCGYICGVTSYEGLNSIGDELMVLKRISLPTNFTYYSLLTLLSGLKYTLTYFRDRLLWKKRRDK